MGARGTTSCVAFLCKSRTSKRPMSIEGQVEAEVVFSEGVAPERYGPGRQPNGEREPRSFAASLFAWFQRSKNSGGASLLVKLQPHCKRPR